MGWDGCVWTNKGTASLTAVPSPAESARASVSISTLQTGTWHGAPITWLNINGYTQGHPALEQVHLIALFLNHVPVIAQYDRLLPTDISQTIFLATNT